MDGKNIELGVGFLVVLALLALLFLSVKVAGEKYYLPGNNQTYELHASFANVGNLREGAPVRSSGVVVGRVTKISLDPQNYQAKVTLRVLKRYHFSTDSVASILTNGLLGEQYIGLQPGGDETDLKAGETIGITNSAVIIEELVNKILVNLFDKSR